jgi:hypothetical protein
MEPPDPFYQDITTQVETIINSKGYTIVIAEADADQSHLRINIMEGDEELGTIRIIKTTGIILDDQATRKVMKEMFDDDTTEVFSVQWLETNPNYAGQGLGQLLLIYAICYIKNIFANVKYVILDDDSNNSMIIGKNIYDSVGFGFRGVIKLDMASSKRSDKGNQLILDGPEKQLLFDDPEVKRRMSAIVDKHMRRLGGSRKRKYKYTKRRKYKYTKKGKCKYTKKKCKYTKRKYK